MAFKDIQFAYEQTNRLLNMEIRALDDTKDWKATYDHIYILLIPRLCTLIEPEEAKDLLTKIPDSVHDMRGQVKATSDLLLKLAEKYRDLEIKAAGRGVAPAATT